jgi:hypothetical protein
VRGFKFSPTKLRFCPLCRSESARRPVSCRLCKNVEHSLHVHKIPDVRGSTVRSRHAYLETEGTPVYLSQDSRCFGRDSNRASPKYIILFAFSTGAISSPFRHPNRSQCIGIRKLLIMREVPVLNSLHLRFTVKGKAIPVTGRKGP